MSLDIPPLDASLAEALDSIVQARQFAASGSNWQPIFESISVRLLSIISEIGKMAEKDHAHDAVHDKALKIRQHLSRYFSKNPPFTVVRLAEILVNPENEGYRLESMAGVSKYVNALHKLVFVESSTAEFPSPVFPAADTNENKTELVGKATEDISLVRIPWLDEESLVKASQDSESSEDQKRGDEPAQKHRDEDHKHSRDEPPDEPSKKAKTQSPSV